MSSNFIYINMSTPVDVVIVNEYNVACNQGPVCCRISCSRMLSFSTLRPRQNGRHFADEIFNCKFLNENVWIPVKISLKFVSKDPINNITALVQIMAGRRPGDKPLSEPMMVNLLTHICVTRPQWLKMPLYSRINHWSCNSIVRTPLTYDNKVSNGVNVAWINLPSNTI